jgi:predicted nuclease of restriction endonuclease-like (RecB) superfamily
LRDLILELGKGFAFAGSQYPLEIGNRDYRLDLLFYHLGLRLIGVVLCRARNEITVEYALRATNRPIGVTRY